ncbi:MAG TPA: hypothetical protein DIU39_10145 [Flavobacteriales bacterium]|nr:hypothetical protein [Flavobacteriales bacterium]|tara:strand:+ start:404 stop:703 length:300 start_codon:yes stop_codon:yes gene_type:complete
MKAPKLPTFIKQKKPNKFEFRPRYYDAKKEKMQERRERISAELGLQEGKRLSENKELYRQRLRESWQRSNQRAKQTHQSSIRIIVILFMLLFLAWMLLK